jgi:uncharacterized protein
VICERCTYENHPSATYCSKCGKKVSFVKEVDFNVPVKNISLFFFILLGYITVLHFTSFGDTYISVLIADSIFAFIILLFFWFNYRSLRKMFYPSKPDRKIILTILIAAPVLALSVHFFARFLNQNVFNQSESIYYNQFSDSPLPLFFSIISIGVFPAIFEELAFRGILFNETIKITGIKPTVLITAILFTILHLSLISIIWIFPIGLLFGYFRARYKTMFYGIFGHFMYNTCIVIIQIILT